MDLDKLRAKKTVLERSRARPNLPKVALYLEWLGGSAQRRVVDVEQNEHVLDDKTVQSYYRLVSGAKAKDLVTRHWPQHIKATAAP